MTGRTIPTNKLQRLAPEIPFPAYAYVPGRHPHPTTADPSHMDADLAGRFAVDLFNHGYYWEAHEAWELLWRLHGRSSLIGRMVQGLIMLAAVGVKAQEGNAEGIRRHAGRAAEIFAEVAAEAPIMLDMSVKALEAFAEEVGRGDFCRPAAPGALPEIVLGRLPG